VAVTGEAKTFERVGDEGARVTYRFCPDCGSTVVYELDAMPGLIAAPVGAFADPNFPAPKFSVYERRKHPWTLVMGEGVEHID